MKTRINLLRIGTLSILLLYLTTNVGFSQEEEPDNRPVRSPYETVTLIDNQTVVTPFKGALQLEILHRFGKIETIDNLYGIYASANTRIGLNYGITDKIMVGIGTTRDYKLQDIQWKYNILQQTRSGSMPLALTYYGNMVIDARPDETFEYSSSEYKGIHRLSYFNQLIVSRKFGDRLSAMIGPGMSWHNSVTDSTYNNMNFAISAGARAMVIGMNSIIVEYHQPLTVSDNDLIKPGLSVGVEIGTSTHAFRVFVTNYNQIIAQRNLVYNTNDFFKGDLLFGFNISIRF